MAQNTWYRPLKLFDPKANLRVDETFRIEGQSAHLDTLGELEQTASQPLDSSLGKIFLRQKTPSAILASVLLYKNKLFIAGRGGDICVFQIGENALTPIGQLNIGGEILKTPALHDQVVYIPTREGKVAALDLEKFVSGTEKESILWQKVLPKSILSELVVEGNTLLVASLAGLYAFDAWIDPSKKDENGHQLWVQQQAGITAAPGVSGGNLYVGSEEKVMTAFQFGGSEISQRWSFPVKGAIRTRPGVSEKNNYVLFASMDGSLYCLDRLEGIQRWYVFLNAPVYSTPVVHPLSNVELYLIGADNGYFYCFDTYGKRVWTFRTGGKIRTEALVHEGVVYFGSGDNALYALDVVSGKLIFKTLTDGPIAGKPVVYDGRLYVGSADSFVYGVNIK